MDAAPDAARDMGDVAIADIPIAQDATRSPEAGLPQIDCGPGRLALPGELCSETWTCPAGWLSVEGGFGCEPPPLREDCGPGRLPFPPDGCTEPWECPPAWHRVTDTPPLDADGLARRAAIDLDCAPPALREDCATGAFGVPGGGCTAEWICPVGWHRIEDAPTGCLPAGDDALLGPGVGDLWGERAWPADTLYVDPAADPVTADGTRIHPFASPSAALDVAAEGGTVALAPGVYAEPIVLTRSLNLAGRCAHEVSLSAVEVDAEGPVALSDLTLGPTDRIGAVVRRGDLSLNGVRIEGAALGGLLVQGGAQASLEDVRVSSCAVFGISVVDGGTSVTASRLFVADVAAGPGLRVSGGARVVVADAAITRTGDTAVTLQDAGTTFSAERLVVADARPATDSGARAWGLSAMGSAQVTLTDVLGLK